MNNHKISSTAPGRMLGIIAATASGKAALAAAMMRQLRTMGREAELISVDSMKVYRGMDIGTAKPPPSVREHYTFHLLDVADPNEPFSVARFVELADEAYNNIRSRSRAVIAVGGTALYWKGWIEGLFEGPSADAELRSRLRAEAEEHGNQFLHDRLTEVDPEAADRIHPNDLRRLVRALEVHELTGRTISSLQRQFDHQRRYEVAYIGLRRNRAKQNERINARVKKMMTDGLLDEVRQLLRRGVSPQARQGLGYAELIQHLEGRCTLEEAVERIKINTRRFARGQMTWFRRFPDVHWIDMDQPPKGVPSAPSDSDAGSMDPLSASLLQLPQVQRMLYLNAAGGGTY